MRERITDSATGGSSVPPISPQSITNVGDDIPSTTSGGSGFLESEEERYQIWLHRPPLARSSETISFSSVFTKSSFNGHQIWFPIWFHRPRPRGFSFYFHRPSSNCVSDQRGRDFFVCALHISTDSSGTVIAMFSERK
ncbi:unnamed protein product [Lactuca virosa]|uniref:Uncharacterized protein n=1 Tax=Lactuca virosa TaxID=75947 RepID=A0AAU9N9G7_9ASTR|nr:unnamed protein product [Lactuca virosa]